MNAVTAAEVGVLSRLTANPFAMSRVVELGIQAPSAQPEAPASALKVLPVKELEWLRPVGVIYRRETYLPPAVRRFIEIIKVIAKDVTALR
jgi:DNA-binding transcriptional LysR family regulator